MTVMIEISDKANEEIFQKIFSYFEHIDKKFSTYKDDSEISKINKGILNKESWSEEMKEVFYLADETKKSTKGYFDILTPEKKIDPSGIVKGWAIKNASHLLKSEGYKNFYINAGGDIELSGKNKDGVPWTIGIRNPQKIEENVKVLALTNKGVATSGNYVRGAHIYNPIEKERGSDVASLTVIGPNIYEADRFATAAFAMGEKGIYFIEKLPGLEGYMINKKGMATMTSGFENYVLKI